MTALITEAFNEAIKRLLNTANMLCEDDIPDSCLFLKFYKIRQRSLLGRPRSGEQIRKSEYLLLKNNYAYITQLVRIHDKELYKEYREGF